MEHTLIATETSRGAEKDCGFMTRFGDHQSRKICSITLLTVWSVGYVGLELNQHYI